ncbi:MAG: beta-ketoacyl synthase [Syntrophus sp. (in: bacteria)]|nr:beta-ketoacyl synthase [Syntrophus sp. (in: bacteria)]
MEIRRAEIKKVCIVDTAVVTALGNTLQDTWKRLIKGDSGIGPIKRFPVGTYDSRIAATVDDLRPIQDRSIIYDLIGRLLAGLKDIPQDTALITATTKLGIDNLENIRRKKAARAGDVLPSSMPEMVSGKLGLKKAGINVSASCASSTIAIAQGSAMIASGQADAVLVCCADIVTEFTFSGFSSLKIVSPVPCRPFDKERSGLTLGDGAAALFLMSDERAIQEGRKCMATIKGWGIANDAFHITSPAQDGSGLASAIEMALVRGGLQHEHISAISAHGTGTMYNDLMELTAFNKVFCGRKLPVYSVKGATGHTVGASGGIEVALATETLAAQTVPPTAGFQNPEEGAEGMISSKPVYLKGDYLLTTNSGFGGINAAILLERGTNL